MNNPIISVIIPVYNVEKYLSRCLDSVINQTIKDIEIICVNDCTQDNCDEILKRYKKYDNRINTIKHDRNRGLSAARNTGLSNARGKYIYFIDSDDWVDLGYLEEMLVAIEANNVDVVFNSNILHGSEYEFIPLIEKMNRGFQSTRYTVNAAWAYLIKKSYLNKYNVVFPEGLKYEDFYFNQIIIRDNDEIYTVCENAYYYFRRTDSIMGDNKVISNCDIIGIYEEIYRGYKVKDSFLKRELRLNELKIHLDKNIDKELFYKNARLFLNKIKYDIESNISYYSVADRNFLYDILKCENYAEYQKSHIPVCKHSDFLNALRQNIIKSQKPS
jgi:glycosyltransferase involved in cell wall biosynthesis